MRLVAFEDLKPNMLIADDFYGISGAKLAKKGVTITEKYIKNLAQYEIPFLYVIDKYGANINVRCSITTSLRNEATQHLKKLYNSIRIGRENELSKLLKKCTEAVSKLVDDIIAEKIDLYDVFDIKMIENYKYQQPVNVMIISLILGKALGYNHVELYELALAAYFHDIGNNFIKEEVLTKFEKLTDDEYDMIKGHAEKGYKFSKEKLMLPMKIYLAIGQHHERYDGSGYPYSKNGDNINRYSRIIAIADVFDALSSRRRQRPALNPSQAFKIIIEGSGKQFDPELVKIFMNVVSPYPIGYTLKLPDGREGVVIKNFKGRPFNPIIKIIKEDGRSVVKSYDITLGKK